MGCATKGEVRPSDDVFIGVTFERPWLGDEKSARKGRIAALET